MKPINSKVQKLIIKGNNISSCVSILRKSIKNWAEGCVNTFSGLDKTAMKGKTAEMLMASMKDATVIRPSNKMK